MNPTGKYRFLGQRAAELLGKVLVLCELGGALRVVLLDNYIMTASTRRGPELIRPALATEMLVIKAS